MWQLFIAGSSLGFISSFHCIGMCGPLVLALPLQGLSTAQKKMFVLLYHSGRVTTYILFGLLSGTIGRRFYVAGLQQYLSVAAGVIILLIIIKQQFFNKTAVVRRVDVLFKPIKEVIYMLWQKTSAFNIFLLGMLNGLLPCGMVYFALIATLGIGNAAGSMLFMALFGAGTLPLMVALHLLGAKYINVTVRNKMRKSIPVLLAFMGLLLILRGLNLGTFLSPYIGKGPADVITCH